MKINWGWGLAIGMVLFIAFIMYFVISMTTNQDFNHDMVTEDYYAKEMVYQDEIDAETNVRDLNQAMVSKKTGNGWIIVFPQQLDFKAVKGTAYFYRPSNEKLDFEVELNLDTDTLFIPKEKWIEGRWNITIDWEHDGKPYLYKESITY